MSKQWYGEWYEWQNESEKEEVKQMLILWRKHFLRKIHKYEIISEEWIERTVEQGYPINCYGLKLCIESPVFDNRFEYTCRIVSLDFSNRTEIPDS